MLERFTEPAAIARFLHDRSGVKPGQAQEVVFVHSTAEVVEVMKSASASGIPITVSGNGTGVNGGRIPSSGIVLAMERMERLFDFGIDLRSKEGFAVVQPGMLLSELRQALAPHGWTYMPDPTEPTASVGGTIATNAAGARSYRYGATRANVRALEVVLADGDILDLPRGKYKADLKGYLEIQTRSGRTLSLFLPIASGPQTKSSAGYFLEPDLDAVDLFIGQEGTLGIITQAELRIHQIPSRLIGGMAFFASAEAALRWVALIRKQMPVGSHGSFQTNALEFFDDRSLQLLRDHRPELAFSLPPEARSAVYFEQSLQTTDLPGAILGRWQDSIKGIALKKDGVVFAEDERTLSAMTAIRHAIPAIVNEAMARRGLPKIGTDLVVPESNFPTLWQAYKSAIAEWKSDYVLWGHLGDHHLHLNFMPTSPADVLRAQELHRLLAREAVRLEGTVAGEHGIGKTKHDLLAMMLGTSGVENLRTVKRLLDPKGILCPGNIFDYNKNHELKDLHNPLSSNPT